MRQRLFEVYRRELMPIDGVAAMLNRLAIPRCVASSSQMERLRVSLEVTGLSEVTGALLEVAGRSGWFGRVHWRAWGGPWSR